MGSDAQKTMFGMFGKLGSATGGGIKKAFTGIFDFAKKQSEKSKEKKKSKEETKAFDAWKKDFTKGKKEMDHLSDADLKDIHAEVITQTKDKSIEDIKKAGDKAAGITPESDAPEDEKSKDADVDTPEKSEDGADKEIDAELKRIGDIEDPKEKKEALQKLKDTKIKKLTSKDDDKDEDDSEKDDKTDTPEQVQKQIERGTEKISKWSSELKNIKNKKSASAREIKDQINKRKISISKLQKKESFISFREYL